MFAAELPVGPIHAWYRDDGVQAEGANVAAWENAVTNGSAQALTRAGQAFWRDPRCHELGRADPRHARRLIATAAFETLLRSRRRLWLPVEHPLLNAETISLEDVAREPYVMLTIDEASRTAARYWKPTGLKPNVVFRTSSVEAVRSMVADGIGITLLSDMVYRPWSLEGQRIELRSVAGDIPTMDVGLAWSRSRPQSPATRTFHEFLSLSFSGAGSTV